VPAVNPNSLKDLMVLRRLPEDGAGVHISRLVEAVFQDELTGARTLYNHWRPAHRITEDRIRELIKGKLLAEGAQEGHRVVFLTQAGRERLQLCGPDLQGRLDEIPAASLKS